jgi:(p)ppGpp synthase/HD superfamily hydrolase
MQISDINSTEAIAPHIAQTHLQLMQQMLSSGYTSDQQVEIARVYELATRLFSGRYRQDGRSFLSHLIGTASVLVWLKASQSMVIAGLLHAIFEDGNSETGPDGMARRRRELTRIQIGAEAERLIASYTASSRTLKALLASHKNFNALNSEERDVLLIQLANEFDDYRDCAPHFTANAEKRLDKIGECGQEQVEMARWLGFPEFADLLAQSYQAALDATPPVGLRSTHSWAYTLLPLSSRRRTTVVARQVMRSVLKRLRLAHN